MDKIGGSFGANVEYYRKKSGLSRASLAEWLGISERAVFNWERCGSIPRTYWLLEALAEAVGTDVWRLFAPESYRE